MASISDLQEFKGARDIFESISPVLRQRFLHIFYPEIRDEEISRLTRVEANRILFRVLAGPRGVDAMNHLKRLAARLAS